MSTNVLTPVSQNGLTRQQTVKAERKALTLWGNFNRNAVLFAAEFRKLQDSGAHLIRGYPNFGEYAERTFEGLSAPNAQQISRAGRVMLILEQQNRIALNPADPNLPGTTGLRALSRILKDFGEDTMLAVYDKARDSGRGIIAETVTAATRELVAPIVPELETKTPEITEDDEDDDDEALTEQQAHLLDRLQELRDSVESIHDLILTGNPKYLKSAEKWLEAFLNNNGQVTA